MESKDALRDAAALPKQSDRSVASTFDIERWTFDVESSSALINQLLQ